MERNANRLDLIFVDLQKTLFRRLRRIVGDPTIAEDLTQEAYLRARRALETTVPNNIEAFLWITARNLAVDHVRREKIRSRGQCTDGDVSVIENIADDQASLEDRLIHREHIQIMRDALQRMPLRAQKAWTLSRMDGLSYPQVAERLGVSPNTIFNDIKMVMAVLHGLRTKLDE